MFRLTEAPSPGKLIQSLAKTTKMVLSCPLTWTWSMLWQHMNISKLLRQPDTEKTGRKRYSLFG
jgi:hypothetical protein